MNKRIDNGKLEGRIAVDINTVAEICGVGLNTARKIGEDAGASFTIGRRRLYNVEKIKKYLNSFCEE